MAFNRPTLQELVDRIKNDFTSRLTSGSAVLRKSVVFVLSRVIAGASHILHGHLDWIAKQLFPDTAALESLKRWASIWDVTQKPADFAGGNVTFTGTNGLQIPALSELQRSDGAKFVTDALATITGGTATVAVTAVDPGADGNTEAGVTLTLVSPIAGIQSAATVAAGGITDGQDEESPELLLGRLLQRIQNPPQGGSESDFERWALENSGVTRAWVYPLNQGAGTVGIAFVLDGEEDIFPDAGKVAEVQDYIDARRPVTIEATVFAPIEDAVDMAITLSPNTAEVRAAVEAELADLFKREAEPGGTILLSHIREAVSIAAGETDHTITSIRGTTPANVVSAAGELAVVGTVSFS